MGFQCNITITIEDTKKRIAVLYIFRGLSSQNKRGSQQNKQEIQQNKRGKSLRGKGIR